MLDNFLFAAVLASELQLQSTMDYQMYHSLLRVEYSLMMTMLAW